MVRRDLGGLALYGFVFSGFMLGSLVGTVLAGREADRRGPTPPFLAGVGLFVVGLLVGGAGPVDGGAGARSGAPGPRRGRRPGRRLRQHRPQPARALRPRMLAMLSTAWVLPGLFAPAVSAVVVRHFGWRWIFLGLVPFVALAAVLALPGLLRLRAVPEPSRRTQPVAATPSLTAVGVGLFLGGLTSHRLLGRAGRRRRRRRSVCPPCAASCPPGTLTGRPGLPAAILSRGLLTFLFFGVDSYVPLAVQDVRHRSPALTGLAITAAALLWTAGSWVQAHLASVRSPSARADGHARSSSSAWPASRWRSAATCPWPMFVVAWGVAGLGMGLAYGPITLLVLRDAATRPGGRSVGVAHPVRHARMGCRRRAGRRRDHRGRRRRATAWPTGVAVAFAVAGAAGVAAALRHAPARRSEQQLELQLVAQRDAVAADGRDLAASAIRRASSTAPGRTARSRKPRRW